MPSDTTGTTGATRPTTLTEREHLRRVGDALDGLSDADLNGMGDRAVLLALGEYYRASCGLTRRVLAEHDALTADNARLREALEFYADPDNWRAMPKNHETGEWLGFMTPNQSRILRGMVVSDYGKRAADALQNAPAPTAPAQWGGNAPETLPATI